MLSRLGKKLRDLVSRDTAAAAPTAHGTLRGELSCLITSDAEHTSTFKSDESGPNTAATKTQQDVQPASVLVKENPPSLLEVTESKVPAAAPEVPEFGQKDAVGSAGPTKRTISNRKRRQILPMT